MGQDISSDVADLIGGAKTVGASENIRHGRYRFIITNIAAEIVENDKGNQRMAFWEVVPFKSEPNPQTQGDRVDYVSPQQPGTGALVDDGTKPNPVGSKCAMKVNFDGPGGRSAGSNIKDAILALFNKKAAEVSDEEIARSWCDLARQHDVRKGEAIGFDQKTNKVILADKDYRAQPARGMVIDCVTMAKKKKTPNDKGAYITRLIWSCAAPIGTGENALELVAKRRAEIEASQMADDDEAEETPSAPSRPTGPINAQPSMPLNGAPSAPANGAQAAPPTPPTPPSPPAPPAPPKPPAPFVAVKPWEPMKDHQGATPDTRWFWSNPANGGDNSVKNEVQLRG